MTPDERERLARLEEQNRHLREDIGELKDAVKEMGDDVRILRDALYSGKGGWKVAIQFGGVLLTMSAVISFFWQYLAGWVFRK